ncbi:RNA polymerase II subunit 5-mediating protein homolog isoform X2 [Pistacia vera]|uniref:RNA polymerase II subunit 5-mediating protein homolog isoform X1 n=1 Tax=Pistacia vera TaxID=55513 RepID=UPI00126336D2|nr:RNA polymerase II subunit 5-mediating protein homolog isoform X1 [Pistacia vera]XP_031255328.1 RNA polymerase II subunit 5-mediating protein homolog isoform X2 [Pistacia vera]
MEEPIKKGTVTSLSSMFPAEDAQKAAKRVQDTITEKQQELDRVNEFIADNTNLINFVQKLPEELHHDIMVPFGKAAFFPGRLIHTNEILVLLGEGYYADRTSKQTVEILKRRGKDLESQADSLKAMMKDLQAEASFFNATASEAAEGLVEIREEYLEEKSEKTSESGLPKQDSSLSEANNFKDEDEDEEYARIMSRLDELELEELAAESDNWDDDGKQSNTAENDNDSDEDKQAKADFDPFPDQSSFDHNLRHPQEFISTKPLQQTKEITTSEQFSDNHYQQNFTDQSCTGLTVQAVPKDAMSHGKALAHNANYISAEQSLVLPEGTENVGTMSSSGKEVSAQTSKAGFDSGKAFTGSIVEHTHNIHTSTEKPSGTQPSKPVSRFKMQRK